MSKQRRCDYTKCVDGNWYLTLGDEEHAYEDIDCTVYGPFYSEEATDQFRVDFIQNPGGSYTYREGTASVPAKVVHPDEVRRSRGGND